MNQRAWTAEPGSLFTEDIPDGDEVVAVRGTTSDGKGEQVFLICRADKLDLQLVLAAPKLLAAAKDALEQIETDITMEWPASQAAEKLAAYEPLRQAIAAAETPSPPA